MMKLRTLVVFFAMVMNCFFPELSKGAIVDSEEKITSEEMASADYFGRSVAAYGNSFIAGATGNDRTAHVYEKEEGLWTRVAVFTSPGASTDRFGSSVSISEDYAVVGAPQDPENGPSAGCVYIYPRNGRDWGDPIKLLPDDGSTEDLFGCAVSISGATILIGAKTDDQRGSAYVFERIDGTWTQVTKLVSDDIDTADAFGAAVSISGAFAVVGAYGDDDIANACGSAYIFQRIDQTWGQTQKVTASDARIYNYFGDSVSMGEGVLVVGAYGAPYNGSMHELNLAGQAYLFELTENGWVETQRLIASDQARSQRLSREYGVSISGDYLVIGAHGSRTNNVQIGAAYVFKRDSNGWNEIERIIPGDGAGGDYFGYAVSISGANLIVSAYRDDTDGYSNAGSVYAYEIETCQGDLNQDHHVDGYDLFLFAQAYGRNCSCPEDFDGNASVDEADVAVMAQRFAMDCTN